ncbi:MAG TPA: hypothetical protein VKT72_12740 [Candidatus Baltobacteraceae bacterium]|nr:hypothetical protein [Candidatus Baltobacteraceae bacterium]
MRHPAHQAVALMLFASCVMLAACNSSTSPSPAVSPSAPPSVPNISGDYIGTMTDAVAGNGAAKGTLAQNGANAGGDVALTGSSASITAQFSLTATTANSVSGAIVIDYASGTTCTFSTTGTYTNNGTNSAVLSGTYTAVTNCTGDTGSYTLNQQCNDTVTSADRRVFTFPIKC